MNYDEAVGWLYSTQLHGIRLGLENIRALLAAQHTRADRPKIIHVAGTNGKGSVCAMLDAICRAAGYRTGLFISPHLVTFRERIRVNGEMIPEADVARGLTELEKIAATLEHPPTFFELATALALAHFQRDKCEVVVLETGLGGRLDATNAVTPAVTVITPIGLDHQQWLGDTIGKIAAEKAGIFKPEVPAVSSPQAEEAAEVLRRHAREIGSLVLDFVEAPWDGEVGLAGSHQRWNAALAVRALALAGIRVAPDAIAKGLREVQWPGRFQRIGERLILDGAHNAPAAVRLVETWREVFGTERATLVLGILADKDLPAICAALLPLAARVIAVPVKSPRTASPEAVRAAVHELEPELPVTLAEDLGAALSAAESYPERALVCGSLFLVGEVLARQQAGRSIETSAQ